MTKKVLRFPVSFISSNGWRAVGGFKDTLLNKRQACRKSPFHIGQVLNTCVQWCRLAGGTLDTDVLWQV